MAATGVLAAADAKAPVAVAGSFQEMADEGGDDVPPQATADGGFRREGLSSQFKTMHPRQRHFRTRGTVRQVDASDEE